MDYRIRMERILNIPCCHRVPVGGLLLLVCLLSFFPPFTFAGEGNPKPLWELGLAGISGYGPDYPAADESRLHGIVIPYFIYRGDIFRAGDKGIARGRFVHTDRLEFDLSLDGSFDTESDDNDARRGMPDLDYLFEVGPRLQIRLARDVMNGWIDLELPVRGVIATDFSSLSYQGIVFHPQLAWQHDNFWGARTRLKIGAGPIFATEEFMAYFYEVEPRFQTPQRSAFLAEGGYLGSEAQVIAMKEITDNFSLFGTLQLDMYKGSTNEDGPLFRDDFTVNLRLGLIWRPFQSKKQASD